MNTRGLHDTRTDRGFGLIELMVTLIIMSALLAVVFFALTNGQRQSTRVTNVADERQMARTAVQLMEREARMAGSGWGRTQVYTGGGSQLGAINSHPAGNMAQSDSVVMLGAWQASTTTTANVASTSNILPVTSTAGFADSDLVVLTDADNTRAHLLQVTSVASSTQLNFAATSPYNSGLTNWMPSPGYPTGSFVFKVTMSTYMFDSTSYRKPVLLRREAGKVPQVVAYNVNGFHVWYLLQDGTWTRTPATMSMVDRVIPVVLTRVTDARLPTIVDSVYASVRPRTF